MEIRKKSPDRIRTQVQLNSGKTHIYFPSYRAAVVQPLVHHHAQLLALLAGRQLRCQPHRLQHQGLKVQGGVLQPGQHLLEEVQVHEVGQKSSKDVRKSSKSRNASRLFCRPSPPFCLPA